MGDGVRHRHVTLLGRRDSHPQLFDSTRLYVSSAGV
jgi:hypothetical protein